MISVAKNVETNIFKAVQEFKNLVKQNNGNNGRNCKTKTEDEPKPTLEEKIWKKTSISSLVITLVNQKKKKKKNETTKIKPYIMTRIKLCNFLMNISYMGVKKDDLLNRSFIFDMYTQTIENIKPFSLE